MTSFVKALELFTLENVGVLLNISHWCFPWNLIFSKIVWEKDVFFV